MTVPKSEPPIDGAKDCTTFPTTSPAPPDKTQTQINGTDEPTSKSRKRNAAGSFFDITSYFEDLDRKFQDPQFDQDDEKEYDPNCEEVPKLAQYSQSFSEAESLVKQVVQHVRSHITHNVERDSETSYMLERLSSIESPAYSPSQLIGVLGNSGVGKSTFINAMLGLEGLCVTSEADCGTFVPMELIQMSADQSKRLGASVEMFPLQTCHAVIRKGLKNYYIHNFTRNEELSKDADEVDLGTPALKMFLALFAHKSEFEDASRAEEFLGKMVSADDPAITETLSEWTTEIFNKITHFLNKGPILANTTRELNEKIEPFVQTSSGPGIEVNEDDILDCSPWALVKSVQVSLSHPILAKGITLVDLPGVSDSDHLRVSAAKRYLRRCDVTLVVHTSTRAGDDVCVKKNVMDVYARKRHGGVAVVLTQTDKINATKTVKSPLSIEEQENLETLVQHEKDTNTELKKVRAQIKSATRQAKTSHSEHSHQLREKEELYRLHLEHVESLQKQILITARNRQVTQSLQTWYRSKTKQPHNLDVFCVSSEQYLRCMEPRPVLDRTILPAHMTGMPHLKHYILTLPSRTGKEGVLKHHCGVLVRSVLNQISLSCSGLRPMMKRDHLIKFIIEAQTDVAPSTRRARQDFQKKWLESVLTKFDSSEPAWAVKAGELCDRWAKWNPHGYLSFLRHEGEWRTASCGEGNWNRDFLKIPAKDLRSCFNSLTDKGIPDLQQELSQNIADILESMERQIKANLDMAQHGAFRDFFENVRNHKKDVENDVKKSLKTFATELQELRYESFTNGESNPFSKHMSKIYSKAVKEQPNKEFRSRHAVRTHSFKASMQIEKLGPFMSIKQQIEEQADILLHDVEKQVLKKCDNIFEGIIHDFNLVCPSHEDDSAQALKRRDELSEVVEEAKRTLDGPVKEKLAECGLSLD